jgi:prophage antirepressor-like protein
MAKTNIAKFTCEGFPFRVIDRDGNPWFVLAEVCRVLKISNPSDAATRLDDNEKHTLGDAEGIEGMDPRVQSLILINESGLYSLILRSRKTEAKRFQKWVTAEVLPSIRKTGGYGQHSPALIGGIVKGILAKQLGETMKVITEQGQTITGAEQAAGHGHGGFRPDAERGHGLFHHARNSGETTRAPQGPAGSVHSLFRPLAPLVPR